MREWPNRRDWKSRARATVPWVRIPPSPPFIQRYLDMGKVIEKVKLTNLFDTARSVEVEAVIDTGATMMVLPQDTVDELGLRKIRDVKVKYANGKTELKSVYGVVTVEIKGRTGNFDVLAESEGSQPLVGQVVLEILDLVVDPRTRKLMPNPASPETPMVEILRVSKLGRARRGGSGAL